MPRAVWAQELGPDALSFLGIATWARSTVENVATQIVGIIATKDEVGPSDIDNVLQRAGSKESKSQPKEKPKSGEEKTKAAQTLAEKLKAITQDCNTAEQGLLDCVIDPAKIDATYNNVIIDEETKATVQNLLALSTLRAKGSDFLLSQCQILEALFYGPPGTGKTQLVRAMAKESGSIMIAISAANIKNMYVGETEKAVQAAFSLAAKLQPCVLFIDETDALFRKRQSDDRSWERAILVQILQELDGIGTKAERPFVVAATNRASDLDDAFLRRLPHRVCFKLPSTAERAKILRVFLREDDLDPLVDLEDLAERAKWFSGSDLKSLCGQAALAWVTEQADTAVQGKDVEIRLNVHHFAKAFQRTHASVTQRALQDAQFSNGR